VSRVLNVASSLVFTVFLYGSIAWTGGLLSPVLLGPMRWAFGCVRLWARIVRGAFSVICGVSVEVRGLEHRPTGPALIAAKHQGMFDVVAPFTFLDAPCFVLKKELMILPFFGWFAWKTRMIPVDRSAGASALKGMVTAARVRLAEGRQIIIFPEGTRTEPGAQGDYKPGVAALYRDLGLPCHLIATNSGQCWPAHGFMRRPGKVVFEFLEPIPAGLKRAEFMDELERRIETASRALTALNPN
jgi:1-acyl-sn-glycerol-3-phosphate acyltransferase